MFEIVPQTPYVGAIVSGVDVDTSSDEDFAEVYRAWLDHGVICVPGQHLEMEKARR